MKLVPHLVWNPVSIDLRFVSSCQFERKLSSPTGWQNCKFHWPGYNSIAWRQLWVLGFSFCHRPCRASLASDSASVTACASRPAAVATEFSTKNIFNYDGSVKL